jgi:Lrp/AsnC family leucine-responsive transcriptional regulator
MDAVDKKDLRILQELDLDARQSTSIIAKKAGVSQEVATYRIKQLEKRGLIQGYYGLLNVYAFGYQLYRIYVSLQRMPEEKKNEFFEYLKGIKQVGQIALTGGKYDIIIGIIEKTNARFQLLVDDIMNKYGVFIALKDISIITELRQYTRKFISLPEKEQVVKEWRFLPTGKLPEVDEVDMKILSHLAEHGRSMSTEIERATGISRKVVANRIKRLSQEKTFLGARVLLKRGLFGRTFFRILIRLQSTDENKLRKMLSYLQMHQAVVHALKCIGSWEWEVEIAIEDIEKCYAFVSELKDKHDIVREVTVVPLFLDLKYQFSIT